MKTKRIVLLALCLIIICNTVFAVSFSDISSEHWAYEYVMDLANNKVINGYPDGTYLPEGTISKAEFLKLVIAASLPKGIDINDAPTALEGHWAGKYLYVAETYSIVRKGSITSENIDLPITRSEMAMMVGKADVMLKGNKMNTEAEINFMDSGDMNAEEVRWLTHSVNRGLIKGYEDNTFRPENKMTRAEAATMIYRFTK